MRTSHNTMSGLRVSITLTARSAPTAWPTTSTRSLNAASMALRLLDDHFMVIDQHKAHRIGGRHGITLEVVTAFRGQEQLNFNSPNPP